MLQLWIGLELDTLEDKSYNPSSYSGHLISLPGNGGLGSRFETCFRHITIVGAHSLAYNSNLLDHT